MSQSVKIVMFSLRSSFVSRSKYSYTDRQCALQALVYWQTGAVREPIYTADVPLLAWEHPMMKGCLPFPEAFLQLLLCITLN